MPPLTQSRLVAPKDPHVLAFHLPQYHPIPENDDWWGPGFTEWTNVTRGRPLFQGHYQPHLPADLGFYDLRLPEVREQQAALAREAGLNGFVHYHYWFHGRRLLERPVNEILESKQPDFPFCFCWANEPWSRNWDGKSSQILMPQTYSSEDDLRHIQWLLEAFADDRYIKIDGRPVFLVYRPAHLPDMRRTADLWRSEAQKRGFPDLYLCAVRSFLKEFCDAAVFGMDVSVEFKPNGTDCGLPLTSPDPLEIGYRLHHVWDYDSMVDYSLTLPLPDYRLFPGVCPAWDNSVRRKEVGTIFRNSSPDKYEAWLREVLIRENLRPQKESLVFVNAWNEWAEGNHLEPCQRWGHGYITATRNAIEAAREHRIALAGLGRGQIVSPDPDFRISGNLDRIVMANGRIVLDGWCTETESMMPPDLMAYAELLDDGSYRLLAPVEMQRMARPDVVQHHGTKQSLLCGWSGDQIQPPENVLSRLHLLALRARGAAAAVLCRVCGVAGLLACAHSAINPVA